MKFPVSTLLLFLSYNDLSNVRHKSDASGCLITPLWRYFVHLKSSAFDNAKSIIIKTEYPFGSVSIIKGRVGFSPNAENPQWKLVLIFNFLKKN